MTTPKTIYFEDLNLGMQDSLSHIVTDEVIKAFSAVSGDYNPLHLDENYAADTRFKRRIAHGMLAASFISAAFAMKLPGPGSIYVSQTLNFKAPVYIGDTIVTTIKVVDILLTKNRVLFNTSCRVGQQVVLEGEAVMIVPSRPAAH